VESTVLHTGINVGTCPHCGGKLEWKASVGGLKKGSEIQFFQCKGCDHIHTLEKKP